MDGRFCTAGEDGRYDLFSNEASHESNQTDVSFVHIDNDRAQLEESKESGSGSQNPKIDGLNEA